MTTDNMPAEFHMQLNTPLQRNSPSIAPPAASGAAGAVVTPHLNDSDDVRLDIEETMRDLRA